MTASTETGSLILKTDSTQVVKGKQDLDGLAQSAAQAQNTVDALTKAFSPVASAIDRLTAAVQAGVGQMDKLATAQQQVVDASAKMDAANQQAAKSTQDVGESADQASARIKAMVTASMERTKAESASIASGQRSVQMTDAQRAVMDKLNATTNTQADMNARGAALLAGEERARAKVTASVADQTGALSKLIGQIDPTVAAYERLDAMQAKLAAFKASGALGASDYALLTGKIESMRAEVGKASTAMGGLSLNSSMARREMGRLGVDIANGNWGRLAQTTGTLANYTGLLGKAFTGAGLAITSALGVLGLFSVAALKGYLAEQKLNTSLIATGNYAGTTTLALDNMAKSLAGGVTTIGQAKDAVGALATSGKFTSQQISLLAQATVNGGQLMGKSVQQMVSDFEKLQDSPVTASEALTAQYHYLTTATLQQIDALQKQGDTSDASNLALKSYADALNQRAKEAEGQLGTLQKAWDSVKSSASFAWDAMLGVGRTATPLGQLSQQYDDLLKKITAVQTVASGKKPSFIGDQFLPADIASGAGGNWGFLSSAPTDDAVQRAKLELPVLLQQAHTLQAQMAALQATENAKSSADGVSKQVQQDGNDALKTLDKLGISLDGVKTKTDKVAEAAKALYAIHLAGGKLPAGVDFNGPQADAPEGAGWDRIKKQLLYGNKKQAPDPFASLNNLVQNAQVQDAGNGGKQDAVLDQQAAAILKIVDAGAKLITSGQDVAKVQALVATGVSAVNDKYAKQAAQLKQQNIVAVQQYQASLDKQNDALQRTIQSQIDKIGMGDKEYQQQQQINQLYVQGAQALSDLQLKRDAVAAKGGDTSVLDQDIVALKANTDKQVAIVKQGYADMDAAQSSWRNGFTTAFANFQDQAADVATQTAQLFTNAFNGMTDAIVNFATTGKLSFSDLAQSILSSIIKIETQIALSKALSSIFGSGMTTTQQSQLNSGADSFISSVIANANGGVYDSPSLSSYSGQIVTRPTVFAFASGAGIMGEAGPEAIMPLKRGSDGKLGVQAASASNVQVEVNITNNGQAVQAQTTSTRTDGKKVIVDMVLSAVTSDIARGGNTSKAIQQRFGLQRRGVATGNPA